MKDVRCALCLDKINEYVNGLESVKVQVRFLHRNTGNFGSDLSFEYNAFYFTGKYLSPFLFCAFIDNGNIWAVRERIIVDDLHSFRNNDA